MADINECVKNEEFKLAKKKIAELKKLFPTSVEAKSCLSVESDIEKKEAIKKAEQERLKALGFKALKAKTVFTIDYNTITLSSINIGTTFTCDAYGSGYHYIKADRGEKYVMAAMSIKSTVNYPKIPEFKIYTISGDEMEYETSFLTNFARWESYGTYLGNYHDNSNDFSKVSTVRFKIYADISDEIARRPFAIVCEKENTLSRKEDRYSNPPVSYGGGSLGKVRLKIKDFEKDYILVKLFNL
ncbi:MAG: hypothetical protein J6Y15_00725 [Bacteroidaceae bacterium]|nr:hypothetical protein [Bacteroidaceae bacterium]